MAETQCEQEGHDFVIGRDPACTVCGMPHDEAMRDSGFEMREGQWMIEFPAGQPIEFKRKP